MSPKTSHAQLNRICTIPVIIPTDPEQVRILIPTTTIQRALNCGSGMSSAEFPERTSYIGSA
ncbi:hypothetical protein BVRB_8g194190 [Beta vulgaris subsp. vulgaris]|nr:hypothetical protein BVRB_8g194190 [Beta vulgaris subsp. vulgaris]